MNDLAPSLRFNRRIVERSATRLDKRTRILGLATPALFDLFGVTRRIDAPITTRSKHFRVRRRMASALSPVPVGTFLSQTNWAARGKDAAEGLRSPSTRGLRR